MQILRDNLTEFNEGSCRHPPFSSLGGRLKQAEDSTYTAGEKMLTINWPVISRSVDKLHVVSPPKNRARSSQQRRTRNHNPKTEPSGRRLISPLFCSRAAIINDHYREQLVAATIEELGHGVETRAPRKRPPPLVRSRTLPAIVVPGLSILQAQIESKSKGKQILVFKWKIFTVSSKE
ncbi:hypothetical protein V9T40_014780 [Parthenolecanium corni]|uniref:Uncharacterized protein n=1 Tax=Parthenolecanium corni TaxID=536013 RepID=A0AAN9XY00_9HEMI